MNIFLSMTENKTKRQLAKTGTRMLFLEYLSMFKKIDINVKNRDLREHLELITEELYSRSFEERVKTWKCIERRYESNLLEKGQYHQDTLFSYRDNCIDYSTISAIIH